MKPSVTIQHGWISIADNLTDEQQGQFYRAICHYAIDGVIPDLPELLAAIFDLIRPAIDLSVKRKAAQRKGAEIRKEKSTDLQNDLQNGLQNDLQTQCNTQDSTAEPRKETDTANSQTDLQNDLQNGLQNQDKEKKKNSPRSPLSKETKETVSQDAYPYAQMLPEPYREKWIEWEQHRRQLRKRITPRSADQQIKLLLQFDPKTAAEIIDTSIRNGYQGLFPPKMIPQPTPNRKDNHGI